MSWLKKLFVAKEGKRDICRGSLPETNMTVSVKLPDSPRARLAVVHNVSAEGILWVLFTDSVGLSSAEMGSEVILEYRLTDAPYQLSVRIDRVSAGFHPLTGNALTQVGLKPLKPPQRFQRRAFSRVEVSLPVTFFNIIIPPRFEKEPDARDSLLLSWRLASPRMLTYGHIRDLGGGGVGLVLKHPIAIGDEIFSQFALQREVIRCAARVVQVFQSARGPRAGVQFVGLDDAVREFLVRFVDDEIRRRQEVGRHVVLEKRQG